MDGSGEVVSAARLEDLDQIGRSYGEHGLAVAFTDGVEGDAAKRIRSSWNRTPRLAGPEFAAGLMARREKRNPAIVLGASGLLGVDLDGPEGLDRFRRAVEATERHAWRSRLLAVERRARERWS